VDKGILENPRLSWKAKGILIYLLSQPDKWVPQVTDIIKHGTASRVAVQAALQELREEGYARLVSQRTEDGKRLQGRMWHIYEEPVKQVSCITENHRLSNTIGKTITRRAAGAAQCDLVFVNGSFPSTNAGKLCAHYEERYFKRHKLNKTHDKRTGEEIDIKINRSTWLRACGTLLNTYHPSAIKELMDWYFEHHHDKYVPKCGSFLGFAEKYKAIKEARARAGQGISTEVEEENERMIAKSESLRHVRYAN